MAYLKKSLHRFFLKFVQHKTREIGYVMTDFAALDSSKAKQQASFFIKPPHAPCPPCKGGLGTDE